MYNPPSEYYPTPPALARKMAAKLELEKADYKRKRYILDPCAGDGALLEACKPTRSYERWGSNDPDRFVTKYAIEIDPTLRAVLESKGITVVGWNFLAYEPRLQYTDFMINPPFSKAREFVIRAWEMLVAGTIVSLYPVTSLEGKTDKERLVLDLIDQFGEVEMLGAAFAKAERPTDVKVAMITLRKSIVGADGVDDELEFEVKNNRGLPNWTEEEGTSLAPGGFIAQLIQHYDASIDAYGEYNRLRQQIKGYMAPFDGHHVERKSILEAADDEKSPGQRYNTFVSEVTEAAWNAVLGHPRFQKILTERARAMINEFRQRQKRVDFNADNVRGMFAALLMQQDDLLNACVQDAFDTMTKYHTDNRIHVEGWKSDVAWKVNEKKVVLPGYVEYRGWSGGNGFDLRYIYQNGLDDIDRAMCVVTGKNFDQITTVARALDMSFQRGDSKWVCWSTFFEARYFKKGTLHLRFLDPLEWEQFNIAAAKGRKWVGGGFS